MALIDYILVIILILSFVSSTVAWIYNGTVKDQRLKQYRDREADFIERERGLLRRIDKQALRISALNSYIERQILLNTNEKPNDIS